MDPECSAHCRLSTTFTSPQLLTARGVRSRQCMISLDLQPGNLFPSSQDSLDTIRCDPGAYPGDKLGTLTGADPVENHWVTDVATVLEAWQEACKETRIWVTLGKHCEHNVERIDICCLNKTVQLSFCLTVNSLWRVDSCSLGPRNSWLLYLLRERSQRMVSTNRRE